MMPIPQGMALGWLGGALVEMVLAGLIVGALVRPPAAETAPPTEP